MTDLDLTDVHTRLHALVDSAVGIEEAFMRDHPLAGSCGRRGRNNRVDWLIEQLDLPRGCVTLLEPDDDVDQSEWTLTIQQGRGSCGRDEAQAIKLNAETYFGISHWLMTYGWVGKLPRLSEL